MERSEETPGVVVKDTGSQAARPLPAPEILSLVAEDLQRMGALRTLQSLSIAHPWIKDAIKMTTARFQVFRDSHEGSPTADRLWKGFLDSLSSCRLQ